MEVFLVIAISVILWMVWQLYRAKQFNKFKLLIETEFKPKLLTQLENKLIEERSDVFPNTDCHIQASMTYWCQYKVRIMQFCLNEEIISQAWLKESGNLRHCQHLFHIEREFMH